MPDLVSQAVEELEGAVPARLRGAEIAGTGMCVPERVVANAEVAERLGIGGDWIAKRTGVRERRIAWPEDRLTGFAAEAGAEALAGAGASAADLDLVLVATMAADELTPNAAPLVAAELGAEGVGAIDVGAACTGFVSALALAAAQIEAGRAETVLVVGADLLSRLTDPNDRSTAGLLADGAGAALVRATGSPGRIGPVLLGSDGASAQLITATHAERVIRMNGHDTFKHAVARMSEATLRALALAERELGDVDLFVYHQANSRIIRAVGEQLGLSEGRTVDYVARFGNTSAATIPIALALAEREGRLADGAVVLLAAFGAGATWGATVVEWGVNPDG
jgi:3-oxoacyl-[acyl-carrier-protein] synthase III